MVENYVPSGLHVLTRVYYPIFVFLESKCKIDGHERFTKKKTELPVDVSVSFSMRHHVEKVRQASIQNVEMKMLFDSCKSILDSENCNCESLNKKSQTSSISCKNLLI